MNVITPAIIRTKQAHVLVGGKPTWDELKKAYPEILVPFRRTPRGDESYRVETIEHAIKLAEASGILLL